MLGKSPRPDWGSARFCAITKRTEDPDGFFNTHTTLPGPDPCVYISTHAVHMLARQEGFFSPSEVGELEAQLAAKEAQLDAAVAEISELRKLKEGIEGLSANGFEIARKTGRPPKVTEPDTIRAELAVAADPAAQGDA
jgi:hypothetical protein